MLGSTQECFRALNTAPKHCSFMVQSATGMWFECAKKMFQFILVWVYSVHTTPVLCQTRYYQFPPDNIKPVQIPNCILWIIHQKCHHVLLPHPFGLVGHPVPHKSNLNGLVSTSLLKLKFLIVSASLLSGIHMNTKKSNIYQCSCFLPPSLSAAPWDTILIEFCVNSSWQKILKSLQRQIWHHCDTCISSFFRKLFHPDNAHQRN